MKLVELPIPISLAVSRTLALVFTPQLASRLGDLHRQHGSLNCVPMPLTLTDGRLMLSADVLTEVMPGGLLHAMWEAADKEVLGREVEVIPWSDAVNLILLPTPIPEGDTFPVNVVNPRFRQ